MTKKKKNVQKTLKYLKKNKIKKDALSSSAKSTSKKISLPQQKRFNNVSNLILINNKSYSLSKIMDQVSFHNTKVKRDALWTLGLILKSKPEVLNENLNIIVPKLIPLTRDEDLSVRRTAIALIGKTIFKNLNLTTITFFFQTLLASALTMLFTSNIDKITDGASILLTLHQYASEMCLKDSQKIVSSLIQASSHSPKLKLALFPVLHIHILCALNKTVRLNDVNQWYFLLLSHPDAETLLLNSSVPKLNWTKTIAKIPSTWSQRCFSPQKYFISCPITYSLSEVCSHEEINSGVLNCDFGVNTEHQMMNLIEHMLTTLIENPLDKSTAESLFNLLKIYSCSWHHHSYCDGIILKLDSLLNANLSQINTSSFDLSTVMILAIIFSFANIISPPRKNQLFSLRYSPSLETALVTWTKKLASLTVSMEILDPIMTLSTIFLPSKSNKLLLTPIDTAMILWSLLRLKPVLPSNFPNYFDCLKMIKSRREDRSNEIITDQIIKLQSMIAPHITC